MNKINNSNNKNNMNSSNQQNTKGFNMQYYNDNIIRKKTSQEKWSFVQENKPDPFTNLLSLSK